MKIIRSAALQGAGEVAAENLKHQHAALKIAAHKCGGQPMSDTALKPYGYAPGSYQCLCHGCGEQHVADKRAWRCLKCAVSARGKVPLTMSDPTTDRHTSVPSMKGRMARAVCDVEKPCVGTDHQCSDRAACHDWDSYLPVVDAILTELEQPSEAMIEAMMRGFSLQESPHVAMRDALVNLCHFIRNEG